jgi:hypothetical protein
VLLIVESGTSKEIKVGDDIRDSLERGWRDVQRIDEALSRGEIDEVAWYEAMQGLIVPTYIAADNPRAQSGHSGDAMAWERARSLVIEGLNHDGNFLDVGCANGHLMETAQSWASQRGLTIEPYGVDLSPEMVILPGDVFRIGMIVSGSRISWDGNHHADSTLSIYKNSTMFQ